MSISKIRSFLYTLAKILGDINAIRKGKIAERIARRGAGRVTGKVLGKIFDSIFRKKN
ncbi:MAG: hypothetical protein NZM09_09700 [Ignavibacterium sp.]|nr:hypothetical protein [Ignavibacterium sp.]MCX7610575.1 hypothetical protein [Ignavibacterium sp.]MDW8375951.1 hypothetical protein [Ignavibacteriales bacterium]